MGFGFDAKMTDGDLDDVVAWLRTLPPQDRRAGCLVRSASRRPSAGQALSRVSGHRSSRGAPTCRRTDLEPATAP